VISNLLKRGKLGSFQINKKPMNIVKTLLTKKAETLKNINRGPVLK